jgi:hypothetical protein
MPSGVPTWSRMMVGLRERPGEVDQVGQLRLQQPGVEGEAHLAQRPKPERKASERYRPSGCG